MIMNVTNSTDNIYNIYRGVHKTKTFRKIINSINTQKYATKNLEHLKQIQDQTFS